MSNNPDEDVDITEQQYEREFSYYKLWVMAATLSVIGTIAFFLTFPEFPMGLATFPPGALLIGFVLWILSILSRVLLKVHLPVLRFSGILLVMIGVCIFLIVSVLAFTPLAEILGINIYPI